MLFGCFSCFAESRSTAKNRHQAWSAKVMEISSSLGFGNSVQHTAREIPEVCSSNSGTAACAYKD